MKKITSTILLFLLFGYMSAQSEHVEQDKSDGVTIALKGESRSRIWGERMPITIEISNSSKAEIEFDMTSIRFNLSTLEGGFTRTYIIPANAMSKQAFSIAGGETVLRKIELSELPFVEFDSTDSGRRFGDLPNGRYRLIVRLNDSDKFRPCVLLEIFHRQK